MSKGLPVRERTVEQHLVNALEKCGLPCIKYANAASGMPDRLVLLPGGRVWWVELKTHGGSLSDLQKYQHQKLRQLGHNISVVWSTEQADELVKSLTDNR